jgi:hypothetical protein
MHRAAAEEDHRRPGGGVAARQRGDALCRNAGDPSGPGRRVPREVRGQLVEAERVPGHEFTGLQAFRDDDLHHPQRQRRVGPGAEEQNLV